MNITFRLNNVVRPYIKSMTGYVHDLILQSRFLTVFDDLFVSWSKEFY